MVYTQWKQRLYALLLRRVLAPYLAAGSLQKLHESIEVSLQEGKFMLKDVDLNDDYLTQILSKRGESHVSIATVKRARIRKLQINLTLEETNTQDEGEKVKSSMAWRAMKLGQGIDASGGGVMLLAHAEIEGFDIELEPGQEFTRPPPAPSMKPDSPSQSDATSVGVIASYVEAAMSSLRLSVQVKDVRVKLCSWTTESSSCQFVEFQLAGAKYHDVDDRGAPQRQKSSYKTALHKVVDFSGITFRTGERRLVLSEEASQTAVEDDKTLTSVIAKTEGSGQVSFRIIEYDTTASSKSDNNVTAQPNESEAPRIQQDLEVSLNQRLNFSVDKESIVSMLMVTKSFLRHDKSVHEDISKPSPVVDTRISDKEVNDEVQSDIIDGDADKEDLDAMSGIMKQYTEARQAAERNEFRGGILVPVDDDGSISFDAFFDANDHSFSLYQSKLEESILASAVVDDDQKDFVHTKLRLHLQQCGVKVAFPQSDEDLSGSKSWHRSSDEYVLLTMGEISLTSSLSHAVSDFTLNIMHLEVEDSFRDRSGSMARRDFPPQIVIGNVLRIDKGVGDGMEDSDGLVTEAPCISFHALKQRTSTSTADLVLEPLELTFSSSTLSNIKCLISQLDLGGEDSSTTSTVPCSEDNDVNKAWRFSGSCPSVSILLPVGSSPLKTVQNVDNCSGLFDRCGYMLPNATMSRRSFGFTLDALSILYESKPPTNFDESSELIVSSEAGALTIFSCHRFLCFVTAPRIGARGTATCMQRADIIASSGHAPLSITHRRASANAVDESIFPLVPPLSSFKARQEDEDSGDEEAFCREFSSLSQNDSAAKMLAADPQDTMLERTEECSSNIDIYLPEFACDLTRDEVLSLSDMLVVELSNTSERTNHEEPPKTPSRGEISLDTKPHRATSVGISIDQVTLVAHQQFEGDGKPMLWYSHEIMMEGFKAHAVLLDSSEVQSVRVLAHELNLFEVRDLVQARDVDAQSVPSFRDRCDNVRRRSFQNGSSVASPIFYRSQLFAPLSPESPAFLLDVLKPNDELDSGELHAHVTVYNMTHRCDLESQWLCRLQQLLGTRSSTDISGETTSAETADELETEPSLFKVFISLADCNLDYSTPRTFTTASRTLVRLGDLRLSSNLILPLGKRQACRVSLGDLTILLCNTRHDHTFENSRLARASTVLSQDELVTSKKVTTADEVLRNMNLITMLTLDSMDVMLALSSPDNEAEKSSTSAVIAVGVTFGMLSSYGCKDSFTCFTETLGELQQFITCMDEDTIKEMKERAPASKSEGKSCGVLDSTANSQRNEAEFAVSTTATDSRLASADVFEIDGDAWSTVETEWSKTTTIDPDEEQAARWYTPDGANEDDLETFDDVHISAVHLDRSKDTELERTTQPTVRIIPNHFPLKPFADSFSESDANIAKYAGTAVAPRTQARVLIRDGKVRCRFFDGYDWPTLKKRPYNQSSDFIIEPVSQEQLESEKERLKEQVGDEMADSQTKKLEAKAKLLGDLLNDVGTDETTFRNTPLPEERGAMLKDLEEQRRLSRRMNKFLQVSFSGLKVRLDAFPDSDEHRLANCIDVAMADFFVAETISSARPVKLLGEWFNETEHPRDSNDGLIMMKMVTWHPKYRITEDNEIANDESQVTLGVLPLRCDIDQRAIRFAIAFFGNGDDTTEKAMHEWAVGFKDIPPPLFQSFKVRPLKLKVNYTPVKVNVEALRDGSYVELINISPLVDMVITLQDVHIQGLVGFGPNVKELLSRWIEDVCATQMYKFLANAKPFQPISSVSGSAANLVVVPWEAYKKGDKVGRAMRAGAASFAGSVAYETLNTSTKLTGFAAQALSSATPDRRSVETSVSSSFLPSRPNDTPRGVGDTASHALESLARGFETANYKIVIVPYREYRRSGTTGAVKSVMRGIPVAIAAPVSAATEALSYTLLGARNQVRPDKRKEEEASERDLRHDF